MPRTKTVTLVCLFALCVSARLFADSSADDMTATEAAKRLASIAKQSKPILWQQDSSLPPSNSQDSFEFSAKVVGIIGANGQGTLMLQMGSTSLEAMVPESFDPTWLDDGSALRLIVKNELGSDGTSSYIVVAAAPDSSVAALETPNRPKFASKFNRLLPVDLPSGHPICTLSPQALSVYPYYRNAIFRFNRRLDQGTLDKIASSILAYSDYYHVDPRLIMAMIVAESGFDPNSTSSTGAMGLGQLMPGTAAGLHVANAYDPVMNIGAAVKILSGNVAQYGGEDQNGLVPMNTLLLTMAAYNAGGGAVKKYHGIPPYRETQNYVRKVSFLYRCLCGS